MQHIENRSIKSLTLLGVLFILVLTTCKEPEEGMMYAPGAPVPGSSVHVADITPSGAELTWTAAEDDLTARENLSYRVVVAQDRSWIDTVEEASVLGFPYAVTGWIPDLTTCPLSGQAENTLIYAAVLVKDTSDNTSLYQPVSIMTGKSAPPTVSVSRREILVSSVTAVSAILIWQNATDDVDPPEQLYYKVVTSPWRWDIDTPSKAQYDTTTVVQDWTRGLNEATVFPEMGFTTCYYAVLVRDGGGNIGFYPPVEVSFGGMPFNNPPDTSSPGFWYDGINPGSFMFHWNPATDDSTPQSNLVYRVLKSTDWSAYDTLAEATADYMTIPTMDRVTDYGLPGVTAAEVWAVSPGNTYFMTVVVKDAEGLVSMFMQYAYLHSPLSSNASLAGVNWYETGMGPIYPVSPSFNPGILNGYTVTVPPGTNDLEIVVNPDDPMAAFTINSFPAFTGSPYLLPLPTTMTNVLIEVTAEDGITMQFYQFTVMKM